VGLIFFYRMNRSRSEANLFADVTIYTSVDNNEIGTSVKRVRLNESKKGSRSHEQLSSIPEIQSLTQDPSTIKKRITRTISKGTNGFDLNTLQQTGQKEGFKNRAHSIFVMFKCFIKGIL
jgi:hypothetical protein